MPEPKTVANSKSAWDKLVEKTESMTVRERLLIAFAGIVVIYGLAEVLYFEQLRVEHKKLDNQMDRLKKDRQNYENELLVLRAKKEKPKRLEQEIKSLDERIRGIEDEILGFSDVMTQPKAMTDILKSILSQRGDLSIKSLKNEEAKPIRFEPNKAEDKSEPKKELPKASLYRHSLELVLEGSFDSAKSFLKKMEASNKNIYWELIEYEVLEYPQGELTIRVFTLSRVKEWIGV